LLGLGARIPTVSRRFLASNPPTYSPPTAMSSSRVNRPHRKELSTPNSTYFDLLSTKCCTTSCTTNPQQIESQQQIHIKLYVQHKSIINRKPATNSQHGT